MDLTDLTPEARPIVQRAAAVFVRHTQPWLVGLVVHGSALKGGFIPGCSDVDLQLYLEDAAFAAPGQLPLEIAIAIHRDLSRIDPRPFRYIQGVARPCTPGGDLVGPIPGAYRLLLGRLPVPEATEAQLQASAARALAELDAVPAFVVSGLLNHGAGRLANDVRLLCTKVWPVLYQVLTLQVGDGVRVWGLTKEQAIELLPSGSPLGLAIRAFYRAVRAHYPAEDTVDGALGVVQTGVAFLHAARLWWEETPRAGGAA